MQYHDTSIQAGRYYVIDDGDVIVIDGDGYGTADDAMAAAAQEYGKAWARACWIGYAEQMIDGSVELMWEDGLTA